MQRCSWCKDDPLYTRYHDQEWGVPLYDDQKLFEMLVLEGMQAGLSWLTILRKREDFRQLFVGFNPQLVAKFTDARLLRILQNPSIIRNKRKIFAVRQNARAFLKVQKEFSTFKDYVWSFVAGKPKQNRWTSQSHVPCTTPESIMLSKDLKKRGFTFVGPTICYAFMQAIGMVNDHVVSCFRYSPVKS